jgi:hypothetical protein
VPIAGTVFKRGDKGVLAVKAGADPPQVGELKGELIACSQELSGFMHDIHRIAKRDSELSSDYAGIQVRSKTMLRGQG